MGSSLAGNQILSTFTGLLKTADTTGLSGTLRTVSDAVGTDSALQVSTLAVYSTGTLGATGAVTFLSTLNVTGIATLSSALNVAGNLAIATNRFTVAAATGNTVVAGTLNVSGACVFTSTGNFSGNLSTAQRMTCRELVQNDAAANSSFAGTLTASGSFNSTGTSTFSGGVVFNSLVTFASGISATSLTATNNSTLASATASSMQVNGSLTVTGNITGNGNVTIGDASGDSLILNAATWTTPNIPTVTFDAASDFLLIRDASDSNRVKLVSGTSLAGVVFNSGNIAISGITIGSPSISGNWSRTQIPDRAQFWFRCKTAHSGFLVGDRIPVSSVYVSGGGEPFFQNQFNDSGWALYRVSYTATPEIKVALTGVPLTFNLSNWDFIAIAEWLS